MNTTQTDTLQSVVPQAAVSQSVAPQTAVSQPVVSQPDALPTDATLSVGISALSADTGVAGLPPFMGGRGGGFPLPPIDLADATLLREAPWYVVGAGTLTANGIEGEPQPSLPTADDGLVGCLLLALLLGVEIVVHSWRYLQHAVADFFYPREHVNIYDERTQDSQLWAGLPLLLFFTLVVGSLSYVYEGATLVALLPSQVAEWSHAIALLAFVLVAAVVLMLRVGVYALVNSVFFEDRVRHVWRQGMRLLILLESIMLGAAAVVAVFAPVLQKEAAVGAVLAIGLVKILVLIKSHRTFFSRAGGWMHIILYFCTLEMAPLLVLLLLTLNK